MHTRSTSCYVCARDWQSSSHLRRYTYPHTPNIAGPKLDTDKIPDSSNVRTSPMGTVPLLYRPVHAPLHGLNLHAEADLRDPATRDYRCVMGTEKWDPVSVPAARIPD